MILAEHSLLITKDLEFSFEEMISLEIALINKGRLLPSHKLDYDQEGNIRVYYRTQINLEDIRRQEEEIIETFLTEYEIDSDEECQSICQSIQSIPQNLMDTVMTGGQEPQASNIPVYNNPGQAVASTSTAIPSASYSRSYPIGQPPRESYTHFTHYEDRDERVRSRGKRQPLETIDKRKLLDEGRILNLAAHDPQTWSTVLDNWASMVSMKVTKMEGSFTAEEA